MVGMKNKQLPDEDSQLLWHSRRMKRFQIVRGGWLRCVLVVLLAAASEGCRRRAKPAAATTENTAAESSVVVAGDAPGSAPRVNLKPAEPITNNVAPPPRVDQATGKLILQTDGVILKQKTKAE
jgi:hypothetical protein